MSGPKDFTIIFAAARRLEIQARRAAERAARKAAAEARLAEQRRLAEERMAEMAALRAAAQAEARKRSLAAQADLAAQRETAARRTAARLASAQKAAQRQHAAGSHTDSALPDPIVEESTEPVAEGADTPAPSEIARAAATTYSVINDLNALPDGHAQSVAARLSASLNAMAESGETDADVTKQVEQIRNEAKTEHIAALDRATRVPDLIRQVVCWQEELQHDEAVVHFCREEARVWQVEAQSTLEDHERGQSNDAVLQKCQDLLTRVEHMTKHAEVTQGAYATRNELLADVIASLQEIGFFVCDPHFENPNDPAGPVTISASRGGEEISASIDLSDTVRSTWDGIAGEHCKDAFFDYVDQMKARGVEVKPTRADLQDRPELKQKSARSLPQSDSKRRST
jgi:hypothetical protein